MHNLASEGATGGGATARRIIAIAGQSNGTGKKDFSTLSAGNQTTYLAPYPKVTLTEQNARLNVTPIPWTVYPARALSPRWQYQFTAAGTAGGEGAVDTLGGDMGLELAFGQAIDAALGNIDLLKCTVDSSILVEQWTPDAAFPTSTAPPTPPNLFLQFVQMVQIACFSGRSNLGGLVWVQGEGDAGVLADANAYQVALGYFFTRLRKIWPSLPVVIVQINSNCTQTYTATVRTAQANYVAGDALTRLVDGSDLGYDGLHYTADAYCTLGQRCATAMQALTLLTAPAAVTWTTDATSSLPRPQNITEWQNFLRNASKGLVANNLIAPPTFVQLCQDLTVADGGDGNVHDSINGQFFTAAGTPKPVLETVVTGQSAKAIGFVGAAGGTKAVQAASLGGPDPTTQSVFRMLVLRTTAAPTAAENALFSLNTGSIIAVNQTSDGKLKVYAGGATPASVNSHVTAGFLIVGLRYNRTAGTATMLSSLEKLALTYAAATTFGEHGIGDSFGVGVNPTLQILLDCTWVSTAAEMTDAAVKALYQAFGQTIPWT